MPYIETKVSTPITPAQEKVLKEKLGAAIENFPGKTERWLMLHFEDNCRLWFMGNQDAPTAYVEIKLFGAVNREAAAKMTKDVCAILAEVLRIPEDRTYVKYEGVDTWGWNGNNF
ncbi:MAG: hypothetical protein IJ325_02980 [Clostridia bacterium]|nr:hypothetical protein [Clostridia bacterium]